MAKDVKNKEMFTKLKKEGCIKVVSNNINKKGELRGKSKKETKILKKACFHHKITKKGHLKPTIYNNGDGVCTCLTCGASFPTKIATKEELEEMIKKVRQYIEQLKFMAASAGFVDKGLEEYILMLQIYLSKLDNLYCRITKSVRKKENFSKNKKKKNNGGSNSSLGGWR